MASERLGPDDAWIGGRIALTAWIVLSVAIYFFGILVPWDRVWLGVGVVFAPVYAGQLVLPVVLSFNAIERPVLAVIASLIYLVVFFSVVVWTGWWREPATGVVAAWPVFLPVGSAILAAIAFAPIYALAAIWDLPFELSGLAKPKRPASVANEPSQPAEIVREFSGAMRQEPRRARLSRRVVAIISLVASLLTIIGFFLQFVL
jgi:hypothetical protein